MLAFGPVFEPGLDGLRWRTTRGGERFGHRSCFCKFHEIEFRRKHDVPLFPHLDSLVRPRPQGIHRLAAVMTAGVPRRRAGEILGELHLSDRAHRPASGLSYGEERRVGLARALAVNPRFLLLDEPAAGLAAAEAEELREFILHIRSVYGCGVLVIEHNMALVMNLCERIHVLDGGKTIAAGTPAEIRADAGVRRAYLGPERLQ